MHKKINTAILLAIVLFIWGLVAYRIWKWLRPEPQVSFSEQSDEPREVPAPATLNLNYRDPFLSDERSPEKTENNAHATMKLSEPQPLIKYKGLLRGKDGVQRAIIEYHGDISTVAIRESVAGVKIIEIMPESITVVWNGQLQTLDVQ